MTDHPERRIRAGVCGAKGRMGTEAARTIDAASDLELVCAADLGDDVESTFRDAGAEVAVDFTNPSALATGVPALLRAGCHAVVGTSGVTEELLGEWRGLAERTGRNVLIVPNFCVGVVLLQQFATRAARFYDDVEILELHHEKKVDSPSGTAADTARRLAGAREGRQNANADDSEYRGGRVGGVPVHSVRLPGLLAHQAVMFGGRGEVLTIRHDSMDRSSFMPGVLLAVRNAGRLAGVHVGLEHCAPELFGSG